MTTPTDHKSAPHVERLAGHDHGGAGHDHGHHHHPHRGDNSSQRRLWIVLMVLGGFTVVEGLGGFWAHSIALLAEAAHMMADCGSLFLAIVAIRISRRPADASRTYGHRRYQPLAAYTNGLLLHRRFGVDHATVQIEEGVCPSPSGSTECRGAC